MPSPVGHSLAGLAIYRIAPGVPGLAPWRLLGVYVFAANAPDLDFVPGLLMGNPNRFHHGVSHSVGFALLFAIVAALVLRWREREWRWRHFLVFLGLYLSHLALDYLSEDTSAPRGLPMFWPVTDRYFISPVSVFSDIQRINSTGGFFPSLLSAHNVRAAMIECLVLLPFVAIALARRKKG
jgi:inner membrane protein